MKGCFERVRLCVLRGQERSSSCRSMSTSK